MNRGFSYLQPSKIFLAISVALGIRQNTFYNSTFHMLDYIYLPTFDYVAQWDKEHSVYCYN